MARKGKMIILLLVLAAIIGILAKPYLLPKREFAVTPAPYTYYQQALAAGKPIFIEFYSDR